jgi:hypothetical protein
MPSPFIDLLNECKNLCTRPGIRNNPYQMVLREFRPLGLNVPSLNGVATLQLQADSKTRLQIDSNLSRSIDCSCREETNSFQGEGGRARKSWRLRIDNASAHTARVTQSFFTHNGVREYAHSPYLLYI